MLLADRRYAFVYFSNVSEAEAAKAILSKRSKWKGNISYAKKEKDISERRARVSVSMLICCKLDAKPSFMDRKYRS